MILPELERALPWLEAAVRRSPGERLQQAVDEILAGRAQLWAGERCALVTQLIATPAERQLHVWLCGGDLGEVLAVRATIESWGRQQGAQAVTVRGRAGWRRILQPHGYRLTNGELRKALQWAAARPPPTAQRTAARRSPRSTRPG